MPEGRLRRIAKPGKNCINCIHDLRVKQNFGARDESIRAALDRTVVPLQLSTSSWSSYRNLLLKKECSFRVLLHKAAPKTWRPTCVCFDSRRPAIGDKNSKKVLLPLAWFRELLMQQANTWAERQALWGVPNPHTDASRSPRNPLR